MTGGFHSISASFYPWYDAVTDGSIDQGDLLGEFPVVSLAAPYDLPLDLDNVSVRVGTSNVIVLTQSCDLDARKIENVLICPHFAPEELADQIQNISNNKVRENIRKGAVVSLYSLPPCDLPGLTQPTRIVNFRQLTTATFGLVEATGRMQRERARLLPPYREHLAQALARFLGRVALPKDYPTF